MVYPDGFQDHLLQTLTLPFRRLSRLYTTLRSRKYYWSIFRKIQA